MQKLFHIVIFLNRYNNNNNNNNNNIIIIIIIIHLWFTLVLTCNFLWDLLLLNKQLKANLDGG